MVKSIKSKKRKSRKNKENRKKRARARRINASTLHMRHEASSRAYLAGFSAMIKFFDLIDFKQIFEATYHAPAWQPKLGNYFT